MRMCRSVEVLCGRKKRPEGLRVGFSISKGPLGGEL